jgi:hypothetical protein
VRARILAAVLLVISISGLAVGAVGQDSGVPLRNSDVVQMMRSGLGRRTIVLLIRQSQCNFDTSPQAMMKLKKAGVSDDVLNAMLAAERTAAAAASAEATSDALMLKAANAFGPLDHGPADQGAADQGPADQATKIHAIKWVGSVAQTAGGETTSFEEERMEVYPDRAYLSMRSAAGVTKKLVVTPDFSYRSLGRIPSVVPSATADAYRQQIRFDPPYVSQHLADYLLIEQGGKEQEGAAGDVVKISSKGVEYVWDIDPQSGRVTSIRFNSPSGEVVKEYSDYRAVGSLTLPFKWRTREGGRTTETTVSEYEVNPAVDEAMFQPMGNMSALSLRVLQTESVRYAQQMDDDTMSMAVNCQITESAQEKGPAGAGLLDSAAFADDAARSNLKMICNSWDTTKFFPHVLNAMLVAASDGNAYVIACDKAWKWSKCIPLETGGVFNASRTEQGIEVIGTNAKGNEQDAKYTILMTKPLQ